MNPTAAVHADGSRRRPRDRKQQILTASLELFAENGYPNVTMAQIADRVGITAGALYRHFANKSMLLQRVVAENFAWLNNPTSYPEYDVAIEKAISTVSDRPFLSDLWTHEIRYLPEEQLTDLRQRMRHYTQSLAPALRQRRPDLDPGQEELLAWAIQSLLSGLGRRALRSAQAWREPGVRAALLALPSAELVPTGPVIEPMPQRLAPVSMRERLLTVAFEQFGQRGYQETTMANIGAAADVTGPNIYGYFASKAELLRAVIDRVNHALWLSLDRTLVSCTDPAEALHQLVPSYAALMGSWASTLEDPSGEQDLVDMARSVQREYIAEWVALLQAVVPALDQRQARVRVQLGMFLISDLHMTRRVARHESFAENLTRIVLTILLDEDASGN